MTLYTVFYIYGIVWKYMKNKILYVTKDTERAQSLAQDNTYEILSSEGTKSTLDILRDQENIKKIKNGKYSVLVFKNNIQIENIAKENNFEILNPKAELSEMIENKITQVTWLKELENLLPEHSLVLGKDIVWSEKPFILQWARSHTGEGTYLINSEKELKTIVSSFPNRQARVTEYIKGPMFTLNIVISKNRILLGNISYQITGMLPFTENMMSTIGNDWSVPPSILTDLQIEEIKSIANKIGQKMKDSGWKGLFGIDVIYDEQRDKIFLIEINARQPASTTYESEIQKMNRDEGIKGITVFEAHIKALKDEDINEDIIEINDGAQIIKRVTKKDFAIDTNTLKDNGYNIIKYNNTKLNSDEFRIQSIMGIMETHNKFNKRGKFILECII